MIELTPLQQQTFYNQVWQWVRLVPAGKVVTYGQVAQAISPPDGVDPADYHAFGARWVGQAMAACPADVPWQRVINAQGKISPRPGADQQRILLGQEGVEFVNDRIPLKTYQWRGPGHPEEPRQASLF